MATEMVYMVRASRRGGHAVHVEKIVGLYPTMDEATAAQRDLNRAKPKHITCITFGVANPGTKKSRLWRRSFTNQPKPLIL